VKTEEIKPNEDHLLSGKPNRYRYSIILRLWHPSMDPAEMSAALGLSPKWAWRAGERRSTPSGRLLSGLRAESYWVAQLGKGAEADKRLSAAISEALDNLAPHKTFFERIRLEGGRAEFFIGWYFGGQSGDTFAFDLLGRLHEMKLDLALDVYKSSATS
jgi:hypothetical protein